MRHEQFAAHAAVEDRHWWFTGRRDILKALVHAVAPPDGNTALLDIGCGTGGNAAAFANEYDVLGIDPSQEAITLAKARFPGVRFLQTDDPEDAAPHLARGGVIILTDVLEHVERDDELLARAVNVLPSGGHLVLTVPADPGLWSRHDTQFGHYRRYEPLQFRALWREQPVVERLFTPFNARLRPVIAAIRRFTRDTGSDLAIPTGPLNRALHGVFGGEARAMVRAIDSGTSPFRRGVSLAAVLRKR